MSISPAVRQASSFEDLLAIPGGDGPYRFTTIFRESDRRERRLSKKKFKLLKRIDGEIRATVRTGERVLFFTPARGLSFWEQWVVGWRRILVVTSRRLLLLQTDSRGFPRTLRDHVLYGAVVRVAIEKRDRIRVVLRSGREVLIQGVEAADREIVRDALRRAMEKDSEALGGADLEHLCPHCGEGIEGRPGRCFRCRKRFKRPWLAALLSLVFPGLGSRYLGLRGFASLEFLAAATVWLAYWIGAEMWSLPGVTDLVRPAWVFSVMHGTAALWTWYVGRRGLYPAGG